LTGLLTDGDLKVALGRDRVEVPSQCFKGEPFAVDLSARTDS
jgi:hypothetical protein